MWRNGRRSGLKIRRLYKPWGFKSPHPQNNNKNIYKLYIEFIYIFIIILGMGGLEPPRFIQPADFKSAASTIPPHPRGLITLFYIKKIFCQYFINVIKIN